MTDRMSQENRQRIRASAEALIQCAQPGEDEAVEAVILRLLDELEAVEAERLREVERAATALRERQEREWKQRGGALYQPQWERFCQALDAGKKGSDHAARRVTVQHVTAPDWWDKCPPCPRCGTSRHWEVIPGGGIDAVCDACGHRGAHDDRKGAIR